MPEEELWYADCEKGMRVPPSPGADLRTAIPTKMKTIPKTLGIVAAALALPLVAQVTQETERTEVRENPDGSVTERRTVTTKTFNPDVRTRVVKYFDPYKDERYGLPPGLYKGVEVTSIPETWRTRTIAPGVVVTEKERPYLVEAPPQLVKLLPPVESMKVRYYVAGGNVVAVDEDYRVVDSIHIPSVKIVVEE